MDQPKVDTVILRPSVPVGVQTIDLPHKSAVLYPIELTDRWLIQIIVPFLQAQRQGMPGGRGYLDSLLDINFYRVQWPMWLLVMEQPWLIKEKNMWKSM